MEENNKKICVNINDLIKDLQKRKCDYWINGEKHSGHHLLRVINTVLDHLEDSDDGWEINDYDMKYILNRLSVRLHLTQKEENFINQHKEFQKCIFCQKEFFDIPNSQFCNICAAENLREMEELEKEGINIG